MSLLEDVFLQDEADEAQELERIIEGDDDDDRPRNDDNSDSNSEKEDEAEEDKRRVDPTKTKATRVIKNPRFVLNPARLTGPRGIQVIPEHFKDFKFKGKGHEREDLDLVLKKLEHWAYRLYPKFDFEDCLKKIESLGKKRPVMVHLHKIRSDQLQTEETVVQKDSSDDEDTAAPELDEFDKLLQQQIELARTPGPDRTPGPNNPAFSTPLVDKRSSIMMPKATSSPSISDEQRERMLRNKRLAEERRLAKLKATQSTHNGVNIVDLTTNITASKPVNHNYDTNEVTINGDDNLTKKRRLNVLDSSDEEDDSIDKNTTVGKHTSVDITEEINDRETIVIHDENNARKRRSQVLDSSDEEDMSNVRHNVTVDIHKSIDLTTGVNDNEPIVITDNYSNKKRANILDSDSEDDGVLVVNEDITVDIHKSSLTKTKEQNVDKVIELDEENSEMQHNRSNVIGSDVGVTIEQDTVVAEAINPDDNMMKEDRTDSAKNYDKDENLQAIDFDSKVDNKTEKSQRENTVENTEVEIKTTNTIEDGKIVDNIVHENDNQEVIDKEKDNAIEKETNDINISEEDEKAIEEIMDVDFSDDF